MSVRFRAGDEPSMSRRGYWEHVASQAIGALELRIDGDIDPTDEIVAGALGAVSVGALRSRHAGGAVRTIRHVRRDSRELCKIDLPIDGSGVVEQDGRQARLRPGDVAFVDLSRPARWDMSPGRVIAVVFPRHLLPLPPERMRHLTAVAIPGDEGAGGLLSAFVPQVVHRLDEYRPVEATRLGAVLLDLLVPALGRLDGRVGPVGDSALASRISAFIDVHLSDPDLSPESIAAANHLSVRSLHRMFATRQATVATSIRERRLERCRRDLLDPALRDRSVSSIAARWGIMNPSHFTRIFHQAYGAPPARYRAGFTQGPTSRQ
jgi:AraC-like DNA-binding protein